MFGSPKGRGKAKQISSAEGAQQENNSVTTETYRVVSYVCEKYEVIIVSRLIRGRCLLICVCSQIWKCVKCPPNVHISVKQA